MARKERNSVDYFPHSVTHGRKMFYLRSKFQNDGYAVWFILLEQLGKSEYHYLDLSDKIQLMYLSSECMVSEVVLKEIIKTLVDFEEFDKELWDNYNILFNEKFIDNISDAYKKRNNKCIDKNSLVTLLLAKGRSIKLKSTPNELKSSSEGVGNTQSIVEYSKEKKTKIYNYKQSLIDLGVSENLIDDYLLVRKNKKLSNTETAFKKLKDEIEKSKVNPNDVISICVEKSWGGFNHKWLDNVDEVKKDIPPFEFDFEKHGGDMRLFEQLKKEHELKYS